MPKPKKPAQPDRDTSVFSMDDFSDAIFVEMVNRRAKEAEDHWNTKKGLKEARASNISRYLGDYVKKKLRDERYEDIYLDNRQFVAVRTIVPFLTARITQPEVTPADETDIALYFARDFEKSLNKHAKKQYGRGKIRLAIQDLLKGERVGVLKWIYDADLDTVKLEHVDPDSIIIGKRSRLYDEPDFVRHKQKRTLGDLLRQFPHREKDILEHFEVAKKSASQLEKEYDINENWIWLDYNDKKSLVVGWTHQNFLFDKIPDPNFMEGGSKKNVADHPMIPFVFFNFLNDGSGYVDETSFMEQSNHLQDNYNKRGQTIADNAKWAGIGVPIFAKGSIQAKDAAKVRFTPLQRILLDTKNFGNNINNAFTTWTSGNLPNFLVEDKLDDRNSIDNMWGTPNIFRGEQSKNNTLGQDVMVRDQAEGRLADPIDCIDDGMERFYTLEAQLMYRYFDEEHYYKYLGKDGKFIKAIVSQKRLAENLGIEVGIVPGTSLPIDRAQKKSIIMQLMKNKQVGTLTAYKELGIFDDPEQAFKEYVMEQTDPASLVQEAENKIFDRDAQEDLAIIISGKIPDERDDVADQYIAYLNEYLLTDKYKFLKPEEQQRVSIFVDAVLDKARRKMMKLAMQVNPNPGVPQPGAPEPTEPPGLAPLQPAPPPGASLSGALQQQPSPQQAPAPVM
jgi:hypothetical protein